MQKQNSMLFTDKYGLPDFKGLGPLLKSIAFFYVFSIIIKKNIKLAIGFLIMLATSCILGVIRIYHIATEKSSTDKYFINMNAFELTQHFAVSLFIALYLFVFP